MQAAASPTRTIVRFARLILPPRWVNRRHPLGSTSLGPRAELVSDTARDLLKRMRRYPDAAPTSALHLGAPEGALNIGTAWRIPDGAQVGHADLRRGRRLCGCRPHLFPKASPHLKRGERCRSTGQ